MKSKLTKPIIILGEPISPGNQPILYDWAMHNPSTLETQLKSIAKAWHEGDVRAAITSLESDLEHG